jgi:acetyltransferase-like isoleucine patch superfamily enzyme
MITLIFYRILSIVLKKIYSFRGIVIEKHVKLHGFPTINKVKSAKIFLSKNVTINSSNIGYHINMHSPCKLIADRQNAIIQIGKNTRIHGTCIHAFNSITIGENCLIAANTQIIDANGHLLSFDNPTDRINSKDEGRPIVIKNNVWIAANCIILGGTIIGEGSVITAGSIIKGSVPAKCIYGGNPGKLIKQY